MRFRHHTEAALDIVLCSQSALILAATLYVGLPLLSLLIDALQGPFFKMVTSSQLWQAFANTLFIGMSAALLSV